MLWSAQNRPPDQPFLAARPRTAGALEPLLPGRCAAGGVLGASSLRVPRAWAPAVAPWLRRSLCPPALAAPVHRMPNTVGVTQRGAPHHEANACQIPNGMDSFFRSGVGPLSIVFEVGVANHAAGDILMTGRPFHQPSL